MTSSLQLVPVPMIGKLRSRVLSEQAHLKGVMQLSHTVYLSNRSLRALFGSKWDENERIVEIANGTNAPRLRCKAEMFEAPMDCPDFSLPASFVIAPPNILSSVGAVSGISKVHVCVADSECRNVAKLFLSEVSGNQGHTGRVQELVVRRLFETSSVTLSQGEVFAVPVWMSDDLGSYTEPSEMFASPNNWIGPGRVLDRTEEIVYFKVVEMQDEHKSELQCGKVSCTTNIFMVAPRKNVETAIPYMKQFLFPEKKRRPIREITEWMKTRKGTGLLIAERSNSIISRLKDSCDETGLFIEVVNCASLQYSEEFIDRLEGIRNPGIVILVLTNFEEFDDFQTMPSSLLEKYCILAISNSYESAIKRVSSPFFFSSFFEVTDTADEDDLVRAYSNVLSRVPGINPDRCGHELRQRRSALSAEDDAKSPNVQWEDIGGLQTAKQELQDLMTSGLRRGVLLYGPPGTGKTLLAKAIATQASGPETKTQFIGVKGPELLSMYIGESEKNVRSVFERARKAAPCVVFFDEIDSLAPARGRASDSANVMDRVVSSLLTELDNLPPDVIVVAATNRPDLLDSSLLRPGRIDRQVYVGIPEDKADIVHALIRQFQIPDPSGSLLEETRHHIPRSMTGSDLAGVFRKAYLNGTKKLADKLSRIAAETNATVMQLRERALAGLEESKLSPIDFEVQISAADILEALACTTPSVSEPELRMYEELRDRRATVVG